MSIDGGLSMFNINFTCLGVWRDFIQLTNLTRVSISINKNNSRIIKTICTLRILTFVPIILKLIVCRLVSKTGLSKTGLRT